MTLRAGVLVFPGSNCDRDLAVALRGAGADVAMVWHKETGLPAGLDLVAVPGGFSFGDYLRCGAIAARSPVMRAVADFAGAAQRDGEIAVAVRARKDDDTGPEAHEISTA